MKLKRVFAFALCVLMAFSLTCCKKVLPTDSVAVSSDSAAELIPEEGAKLTYQVTSKDLDFGKAVAARFKDQYGVDVTVQEVGAYDSKKLVNDISSGTGPDVVMVADDKALELYQAGVFLEISSQITDTLTKDISPVAMKTVTFNDKVYGIPVSIETYVMFYNKNLVTGGPASSFEQLYQEAQSFNNAAENKFWVLSDMTTGSNIYPMLSLYGWKLFGEDGTDQDNPGFDSPEFLKGLQVIKAYHDLMPVKSGDLANNDSITSQFINGKTAYLIGGPWNITSFKAANLNYGVTSLPTYDGNQEKSFAFIQNAHVSASTKYPIAAIPMISPEKRLYRTCFK